MTEPGRAACQTIINDECEYVPTERGALVGWHLAHGEALTTRQAADLLGVTMGTARRIMNKISRAIPIMCYEGEWMPQVMAEVLFCDDIA